MNRLGYGVVAGVLTLSVTALAEVSGEAVYERSCAGCHDRFEEPDTLIRNFMETNNTLLNLKAPTINQLAFQLKRRIGDPKGDREFHLMEVVEFVKDYCYYPDKQKSVCIPQVIDAFETMPSLEGKVTEEAMEAVAEWIYFSDIKE